MRICYKSIKAALSVESYEPIDKSIYVSKVAVKHTNDTTMVLIGWVCGESDILLRDKYTLKGHHSLKNIVERVDRMLANGEDGWNYPLYCYTVRKRGKWLVWEH